MDPIEIPRIPVLGKSAHPPGFSYPIGASAIAQSLEGVPQLSRFTLRYSNRTPIFTMARPWRAFPMLRVTYTHYPVYEPRPGAPSQALQGGERWALEVLPTPAEERLEYQDLLLTESLPNFKEWLISGEDLPSPETRRAIRACWFIVDTGLSKWIAEDPATDGT